MSNLLLKIVRKIYIKLFGKKHRGFFNKNKTEFNGQESSNLIFEALTSNKPFMVSRLGNVEFSCVYQYKVKKENIFKRYYKFIIGDIDDLDYTNNMKDRIQNNAGFFPPTNKNLDEFGKLSIDKIANIDILASIISYENDFKENLRNAKKISFEDLNPYNHKKPWSKALKDKKVLVIHPFANSIESQYKKRELLFKDKDVLPMFILKTYKPVVSIAGDHKTLPYKDWFEALESMQKDIKKIDFEVAILGCGAYGLPLASFIKDLGKKAIHIGGATQMMFGIIGRRWETEYDLSHLVNEHWVRPSKEEVPQNFKKIENGCYW